MNEIDTQYDEKTLIRKEEMELLWGPDRLPPQKLIDYWHRTLKEWLDEYTGKTTSAKPLPTITTFDGMAYLEVGSIVKLDLTNNEDEILVVLLSRKEKEDKEKGKEAAWLCCPISKYSVPATMWEFYASTKNEEQFVAQTWNIVTIKEEELEKMGKSPGANVAKDAFMATDASIQMILHAFDRMVNHEYQDLPMMDVGPRIFRTEDPRRNYQRDERNKLKPIIQAGQPTKEEIQKAIDEKAKAAVEEQFSASVNEEVGKQEQNQ